MKRLIVLTALLAIATSAPAATIGVWTGGAADGGLWSTGTNWQSGIVPITPATATGDEIKVQVNGGLATIDSTMSYDHNCRLTSGADTTTQVINMTGGAIGFSELRVGAVKSSSANGYSEMNQSGGVVTASQLFASRGGSTSSVNTSFGNGKYTISGGTLQYRAGSGGQMWIGSGANTVTGSNIANQVGTFVVDGIGGTISMRKLYVGSDGSTKTGTGIVEFKIGASGVSRISIADASGVILDQAGGGGVANLVLTQTAPGFAGNIVLVEQTTAGAVTGIFDQLNGVAGAATQGAAVVLGSQSYTLSYVFDATTGIDGAGNDIALVVPEPATLAILGLGGLLLRRRLA